MTVKQLKELLQDVDDDAEVLLPVTQKFDGFWLSPCIVESGDVELGDGEDIKDMKSFILVPCGFFDEDHDKRHELN